jgi:flavodoxin
LLLTFCIVAFFGAVKVKAEEKKEGTVKNLIVYYSYSGKTEIVAQEMAKELNAALVKIEDVNKPGKLKAYFLGAFAARKGKSWPIKPVTIDISAYDRVFVGAPIWWGRCAPEINAFIDQTNFEGKQAVGFVTMGGSNPKEALKFLTGKIEAKGGKIMSSFAIKTGGQKNEAIVNAAKNEAQTFK